MIKNEVAVGAVGGTLLLLAETLGAPQGLSLHASLVLGLGDARAHRDAEMTELHESHHGHNRALLVRAGRPDRPGGEVVAVGRRSVATEVNRRCSEVAEGPLP
jgi:hypothetical protein